MDSRKWLTDDTIGRGVWTQLGQMAVSWSTRCKNLKAGKGSDCAMPRDPPQSGVPPWLAVRRDRQKCVKSGRRGGGGRTPSGLIDCTRTCQVVKYEVCKRNSRHSLQSPDMVRCVFTNCCMAKVRFKGRVIGRWCKWSDIHGWGFVLLSIWCVCCRVLGYTVGGGLDLKAPYGQVTTFWTPTAKVRAIIEIFIDTWSGQTCPNGKWVGGSYQRGSI